VRKLGQGQYGEVLLVYNKKEDKEYAMKMIRKEIPVSKGKDGSNILRPKIVS